MIRKSWCIDEEDQVTEKLARGGCLLFRSSTARADVRMAGDESRPAIDQLSIVKSEVSTRVTNK